MKKLSVIVPVYNAEKYLMRCAQSILCQSYKNIELILVNDGSKDSSLELCYKIQDSDERVRVFDKPNGGAASARNLGIRMATGDYIGFCDSDDYWEDGMASTLIGEMERENLVTIECTMREVYENGTVIRGGCNDRTLIVINAECALREIFYHRGNVSLANRITRAEYIKKISIPEGRRVEDFFFTICLLRETGGTAIYNYPFYNYLAHEGSVTKSLGGDIYFDELYFYKKAIDLLANDGYDLKDSQEYFLLKVCYLLSISANRQDYRRFRLEIKKCKSALRRRLKTVRSCKELKIKEKLVLHMAAVSFRLARFAYKLKGGR